MPDSLFTTRNRSFSQSSIRKRMIRSSSQHMSQKQLLKSSTMTSFKPKLQRLIQQGKVQQILNSDKHSKSKLLYSTTINDMQKQLSQSKKCLSTMIMKARSKQLSINKLKNELLRLQRQRESIRANNDAINKLYDNTMSYLDSKKQTKQSTQWIQKSYICIKQRLLKDEYFRKNYYEQKQKSLQQQRLRSQFLYKKSIDINNQRKHLDHAIQSAKSITHQQTYLKNQLIDVINQDRQQKEFLNNLRIQKHAKQSQINQLSSWVIQKQQLNKYLNILYTHRILSQIIRVKNTNLMKKYSHVQSAYLHIKSNTNIIQFQKILKKMQQQDSIYDITVKKVSDLQAQLQSIQLRIQRAKKQRNVILSQQGKLNKLQRQYYQGIEKDKYQLLLSQKQKSQHRITQDDILKQKVIQWTHRLKHKLNLFNIQTNNIQDILTISVDKLKTQPTKNNNRKINNNNNNK